MANEASLNHGFRIHVAPNNAGKPTCHYTFYVRAPRFRVIVFKGGGGRVWVYRKLLHIMEDKGSLYYVKEYGGSSAGALFAVLAAMPLKASEREKLADDLAFHHDILNYSWQANLYRVITAPLYVVSKPLEWTAKIISGIAGYLNKISVGKILGWPLGLIGGIVHFVAGITHPQFLAGAFNLFTKGGIYKGNQLQQYIRQSIYESTQKCLERYLNHIKKEKQKRKFIAAIKRIPHFANIYGNIKTGKLQVELLTKDITFSHFHALAKIKNLGFKDVFLTATRCKDIPGESRLKIFNYRNDPHKPIYRAVRMSMSAPLIYQTVHDNGMEYMDGGCADNFPIEHASQRHAANRFEQRYFKGKYGQDLDVLGVRVEYEKDLGILFEPIRILSGWWEKCTDKLEKFFYNKICGMDIYHTEECSRQIIKEKYSQRVLQLSDHGVGFTEVDIEAPRKHRILQIEEKRINAFFTAHRSELTHMEIFDSLDKESGKKMMNIKMQKKLLKFLKNEENSNDIIFDSEIPHFSLTILRNQLIRSLHTNIKGTKALNFDFKGLSTRKMIKHLQPNEEKIAEQIRQSHVRNRIKMLDASLTFWGIPEDTGEGLGMESDAKLRGRALDVRSALRRT